MIAPLEKRRESVHVEISPDERRTGKISKQNLEKAVVALSEDGVVILDNAVADESLDFLNPRMVEEAKALREGSSTWFNYDNKAQNILQHMIPEPEYLLPDVHANPFATEPVHSDVHYEHPRACFSLAVNVVLIDCSPENGSTECWLGTHTSTKFADQNGMSGIHQHLLDERSQTHGPPVQPTVKKGGIIIRDMRLWHAGMPNRTADEVRVMLNLIFFADWYRSPMTIQFPKSAESKIRQIEKEGGIQIAAEFVDELDHRTLGHTHDFGQDDKREEFGRWHHKIATSKS
ncbi:hypothetical protein H2202_004742 [Exophiala xenobiotica]|nr:hypothetical protein H2202_004742 [Exophiala xenobiotica]